MSVVSSINVTVPALATNGPEVTVQLKSGQQVAQIKVTNSSQFDLQYVGFGSTGPEWLCAGLETMLYASGQNSGNLQLTPFNNANIQPPPVGVVLITQYLVGDNIPKGSWPVSIPFQTVSTVVSGANSIVNDGNPAGTNIVEATQVGSTGSNVQLTNDSILVLQSWVASVLTTYLKTIPSAAAGASVLQLGDAARTVEIISKLLVDGLLAVTGNETIGGTLGVTGASAFTGAATFTVAPQLTSKQIKDNGTPTLLADWSASGLFLYSNPATHGEFNYSQVVGDIDWKTTAIGATGVTTAASGTVNHQVTVGGSGSTPNNAYIDPYNGTPPGSQTMGIGSFTTTTANVTCGASVQALIHFWQH